MKKLVRIAVAVTALSLAVTGCASATPAPTAEPTEKDVLKVGVVISLSGPGSSYGIPGEKTLKLLASEHNASGASPQIKLTVVDDESQAAKSITAARGLLNDGADVILGASISSVGVPLSETLQADGVPFIATAVDGRITQPVGGPVNDVVFQTPESQSFNIATMLKHVKDKGLTKVAMVYDSTALGQGAYDSLVALAPKSGVKVVAGESIDTEAGTAVPQLVKAKEAGAQALLVYAGHAPAPVVQRDFAGLGWNVPIMQSSEALSDSFREGAGDAAIGTLVPSVRFSVGSQLADSDPQKKTIADWAKKAKAELGGASIEQIYYWDAWAILKAGAEKLKPFSSYDSQEELRKAFVKNVSSISKLVGLVGVRTFTPTDHRGLSPDSTMVMVRLTKGGVELVK